MAATIGLALRHPSIARVEDGPVAVAFCAWDRPQPGFASEMVRAARSIAAQAAVAIANATNHAQGEEMVRRLSELASWAARLAAAGAPEQIRSRAAQAAGQLLGAPVVAHWSPGGVTWYPSPPVRGRDDAPGFAGLAARGTERFRPVAGDELPGDLAGALGARGLTHYVACAAADGGSLLFVAFDHAPTTLDEQIATLLTDLAASALRTAQAHARVAHLALTDPLTEVGNRRAFEARITEVLALAVRTDRPTSLCLVDLDNFREFNETGGHQVGDEALRLVAGALRAEMRTSDQAFRIGGDEFALVLADTPAASAVRLLERVREKLVDTPLGTLSITAGVAEAPRQGRDSEALYRAADDALYAGKRAGRGCVTVAGVPEAPGA
jgi:diguanylate cyclase (GGDEF)-like protein